MKQLLHLRVASPDNTGGGVLDENFKNAANASMVHCSSCRVCLGSGRLPTLLIQSTPAPIKTIHLRYA